ncbi:MAG: copper chaperone PCu(A)C [Chloroflexota bacterium]
MKKLLLVSTLVLSLVLVGCRAEPEEVTLENVNVEVALDSEQPAVGTTDMFVTVSTTEGDPITDATVTVFGTMTHAGMVPFESEPTTENTDGVYTVPVEFSMGGDWIFDVTVALANGESTTIEYTIDGVEGDGMDDMDMDDMDMDDMGDMDMDDMDMSGVTSGAYLTITNNGDSEVILVGASAEGIGMIELHETIVDENDMASMVEQENGILVDSGETVEFAPGGLHLMLIDPVSDLVEGETITITLEFEDGTTVEADFVIASVAPEEVTTIESGDLVLSGFWARPATIPEMDMDDMESDEDMGDMDMESDEDMDDMDMESDDEDNEVEDAMEDMEATETSE